MSNYRQALHLLSVTGRCFQRFYVFASSMAQDDGSSSGAADSVCMHSFGLLLEFPGVSILIHPAELQTSQ